MQNQEERNSKACSVLNFNRKKLYDLPVKYKYLRECLDENIKCFLLDLIAFWMKKDCIAYGSHSLVYFLGTHKGTYAVRKKYSKGVTNRYINFLCAIGLLRKLLQDSHYNEKYGRRFMRKQSITIVNRNMISHEDFKIEPMNTFEVFKYTPEELKKCNERAKRLLDANITRGNISYNQLAINGLQDIAEEIYLENRDLSVAKKEREYEQLTECISFLLQEKGYTTKEEIYSNCCLDDKELDKLFKIYKNDLWTDKSYKRPTCAEKELYGLESDKWIIQYK